LHQYLLEIWLCSLLIDEVAYVAEVNQKIFGRRVVADDEEVIFLRNELQVAGT